MKKLKQLGLALAIFFSFLLGYSNAVHAGLVKGIYISQTTLEDTPLLTYLIKQSKAVGIDTFVVDLEIISKKYEKNIALLKDNNINYVVRITMFPGGGTPEQIASQERRNKKYALIQAALGYGAKEVQLDYIRYNTQQKASSQHAVNIHEIIKWYKERLASKNIPLQIDVFGIASFGEEKHIGQNIKLFSQSADAICPMVYPSHFQPFERHFRTPYDTIYDSLTAIKDQFELKMPTKIYAYIELSNYHYPLSKEKKYKYIYEQIKAVQDAEADGWYAWSPNNKYDNLFHVLANYPVK